MKKIIMTAAAAIAAISGAQAQQTATSVNTIDVNVPVVLSITTVPGTAGQTFTYGQGNLGATQNLQATSYNIKSNAPWSLDGAIAVSFNKATGTNPAQATINTAVANFKNKFKFAVPGYLPATPITGNENPSLLPVGMPATPTSGFAFNLASSIDPVNFDLIPGQYVVNLTVTATQP